MQNLLERDSTDKHLKAAYRNMRKCTQIEGASTYGSSLKPFYNKLVAAAAQTKTAIQNSENAYDDIMLANQQLNNTVKIVFNRVSEYEQSDSGSAMVRNLFSDGKFSSLTRLHYEKKPDEAVALVKKIQSLGETHPLYPLAALVQERIDTLKTAIDDYGIAQNAEAGIKAEEKMVKAALRKQYLNNYLDAIKELGKEKAEMLYPALYIRPDKEKAAEKAA